MSLMACISKVRASIVPCFTGLGGGSSTATSVLADVTEIAKNKSAGITESFLTFEQPTQIAVPDELRQRYYIALTGPLAAQQQTLTGSTKNLS